MRRSLGPLCALLLLLLPVSAAAAQPCTRSLSAEQVTPTPNKAPPLRFGIGPLVQAGQVGANPAPAVPEQREVTHAALDALRGRDRPFVLRLNRFFWSDGEAAFRRYLGLARRFARRGYQVELQVRYHPAPSQEGDLAAWRAHVREVVRRFGRIRRVVALQIANEVNLTFSPDSSDGAYRGCARRAGGRGHRGQARGAPPGPAAAEDRLQLVLASRPGDRARLLGRAARARGAALRPLRRLGGARRLPGHGLPGAAGAGGLARRDGERTGIAALLRAPRRHPAQRADQGRGERLAHRAAAARLPRAGGTGSRRWCAPCTTSAAPST